MENGRWTIWNRISISFSAVCRSGSEFLRFRAGDRVGEGVFGSFRGQEVSRSSGAEENAPGNSVFRIRDFCNSRFRLGCAHAFSVVAKGGMGDPENRLHTLIAEIRISEALPGKERKRFSISTLKQAMRRSLARRSGAGRMKSFKVWSGERCGRASVEYQSESADTRSRHSGRPLTLFLRGFVVLTGENRMLSAVVSERSDDPDASQNVRAAEELLDQIRFPDSEKRCLRNKPFAISINDRG